jgi:hypothetical protein
MLDIMVSIQLQTAHVVRHWSVLGACIYQLFVYINRSVFLDSLGVNKVNLKQICIGT